MPTPPISPSSASPEPVASPSSNNTPENLTKKLRKYRGKITVVLLGQIATVLGLAIGSRILTEFVTPEALGEYKLAIGIVGFFSAIFFRPFTQFVMRHYHDAVERNEETLFLAFARRIIRHAMLILGSTLALALLSYGYATAGVELLVVLTGIALLYLNVALSFQHGMLVTQNRQNSAVLIRTIMQCSIPLTLAAGAHLLGQSGQNLLLSELAILTIILSFSAFFLRRQIPLSTSKVPKERFDEWARDGTHFVVPLLSVSLFSWTLAVADRFILAIYHTPHEVGLYTAVYGLGSQPMLMMSGMAAQLIFPFIFKAAAQKRVKSEALAATYALSSACIFGILGMATLLVFGEQIIALLLAKSYRENALPILMWVAAGYALLGVASSFELKAYAGKRTFVISLAYGVATIVNLGLNMLWIPSDGAVGAARATFFSYMAYLISIFFISRKSFAIRFQTINN
jgi:O-antigen/teichoic acid export membrane protein